MKKTNLITTIYAFVMTVICVSLVVYIVHINRSYEEDLQTLWRNYRGENVELLNENSSLNRRVYELEEQIWNIVNRNDYKVTIKHDGATHTYVREYDLFGITSTDRHYTSFILMPDCQ